MSSLGSNESHRRRVAPALVAASLACAIWGFSASLARADAQQTYAAGTTGTFTVPAGVTSVHVDAVGGRGGAQPFSSGPRVPGGVGGFGGLVGADLPVAPGQVLYVYVAGNGANAINTANATAAAGGVNGGGVSGRAQFSNGGAGGGGGASDVRTVPGSLGSRLIVAAGGGGAADNDGAGVSTGNSGNGGAAGQPGTPANCNPNCGVMPAQPGTANADGTGAGGAGGTGAISGAAGTLGIGGGGGGVGNLAWAGGGGGGGLYGGGGGAAGYGQPGAGGASWVEPSATAASVAIDSTGTPVVTITVKPPPAPPAPPVPPTSQIPPVGGAPVLSGLSLSPTTFRAAKSGPSIATSVGTTVRYTLSAAATVKLGVERAAKGRRVKGKCVKPTRSNATKKPCTRYVTLSGSFTHQGQAGPNTFKFSGRLGGHTLKPGSYRLRAVSTDSAGKSSVVERIKFRIAKD